MIASSFSLRIHLVLAAVVAYSAHLPVAQEGTLTFEQQQKSDVLVLKSTVRRVIVDIVVRGPDGKPVHELAARDFSVSEDGKPQHVLSFDVHNFDETSISMPPSAPALPANVFVNVPTAPERGPLYVILYDMVNMEMEDQIVARQQVLKFIGSKPAGTRFAVYVHSDGLHLLQGFTEDKDRLFDILDPQKSRPHVPKMFLLSRNFGRGDPVAMMSVFTHITDFLDGLPGRKNLIWMAGSFPVALYPHEGDPQDLRDDIKAAIDGLARAQVAVYPVNVRGVVVNPEGALTGGTPYGGSSSVPAGGGSSTNGGSSDSMMQSSVASSGALGTSLLEGKGDSLSSDYMTQNDIATATGGRAFYSTNDLVAALAEATEDGANYYSLSYSPTNPNYDGNVRNIRVDLAKRGYHLEYRRSYYADDPGSPQQRGKKNKLDTESSEQAMVNERERPIYASLEHGAPLVHQLIFKTRIHAVGVPGLATPEQMSKLAEQSAFAHGKHKSGSAKAPEPIQVQAYAIYYLVVANQIKARENHSIPLEFAAVAFDSEGRVVNGIFENAVDESSSDPWARLQAKPPESWEPSQQKVYRAMQQIDVPVNATSIRVAVRDSSTDRVGALEITLPIASEQPIRATTPEAAPLTDSAKPN
jgi:VWFA-related protein